MQVDPWCSYKLWRQAVVEPFERREPHAARTLIDLMSPSGGGIMWRTTKASVQHEIEVPDQDCAVVELALTAEQRHALRTIMHSTADRALLALPRHDRNRIVDAIQGNGDVAAPHDRVLTIEEERRFLSSLDAARKVRRN